MNVVREEIEKESDGKRGEIGREKESYEKRNKIKKKTN